MPALPELPLAEAVGLFLEVEDGWDGTIQGANYRAWLDEWTRRLWNVRVTYHQLERRQQWWAA
jgi:hypothetical protein